MFRYILVVLILYSISCRVVVKGEWITKQQYDAICSNDRENGIDYDWEFPPQKEEGAPGIQYRTVSLYGGGLRISVPESFTEMSPDKIAVKYSNASSPPGVVYSNEKASISIAFSQTAIPTVQEDLPEVQTFLSQQLQAAKPINFRSRIEKINGSDYVVFEFVSQAVDSKIYNLMFATDVNGKLILGTFNCTEVLRKEWEPRVKQMLSSVRKK